MKQIQRFFGEFDLTRAAQRITDPDVLHQLKDVLRLEVGDLIVVADGKGNEAVAKIQKLKSDFADISIQKTLENDAEPGRVIALYAAILKRENFEWVVQKATEVGARHIVPMVTKRTIKLGLNYARLQKIAREAAEQSGRAVVPQVHHTRTFAEALDYAAVNDANVLCTIGATEELSVPKKAESFGIFIGPEGGFDDVEVFEAKNHGFRTVNLGKLVLRAETASVIATYLAAKG